MHRLIAVNAIHQHPYGGNANPCTTCYICFQGVADHTNARAVLDVFQCQIIDVGKRFANAVDQIGRIVVQSACPIVLRGFLQGSFVQVS